MREGREVLSKLSGWRVSRATFYRIVRRGEIKSYCGGGPHHWRRFVDPRDVAEYSNSIKQGYWPEA